MPQEAHGGMETRTGETKGRMNEIPPMVRVEDEVNALRKQQIQLSIMRFKAERDHHIRRLRTLTLAIKGMQGELALIERDYEKLPPRVAQAMKNFNSTYKNQSPYMEQ